MTALKSLQSTNSELLQTQNRIATGLRVASSSDNAAYWSIATTMRSDRQALSTASDALGLGAATVDVATKGLETSITIAGDLKAKLVAARSPGVDRDKIQTEIAQLQESLKSAVSTSTFSGENWLQGSDAAATKNIVSSFSRSSTGDVSVGTIAVDLSDVLLVEVDTDGDIVDDGAGILTQDITLESDTATVLSLSIDNDTSEADIDALIQGVDTAISAMTTAATTLGATKTRIDVQKDFASSLKDAIDKGIGQLVDADMNEESTRLQALQVRQQLGVQALSLANQSASQILSLFR
jgi:flagellin